MKSRGFLHFPRSRGRRHSQKSHWMPHMKNIYTPKKKMFKTTATILRGRGSSWVFLIGTFNKVSRLFSDRLQCSPKKSMPGSTHLQNSGYWGRRQVAKNGRIEVVRCMVEICPPLVLSVLPPPIKAGREGTVHTRQGVRGGGGSIFRKTPDIVLASYSIIPLRSAMSCIFFAST